MTMTENDDKPVSPARELRRELIDDQLLDQLLASTSERGISLTGEGGFLPELIKSVLERGMNAELTSHLGYEKNDPAGRGSGNSRNGTTPKTVATEVGPIELDRPRDRNGSFVSRLVPNGQRRLGGLEDQIISLYAGGMTIREIQHHLAATLGTELSHETISNVTEAVMEEVTAWQNRPLEAFYPVIYLDALVVKVRDQNRVVNRHAHIAVGVDLDGIKHVHGDLGPSLRRREVLGSGMRPARQPRRPGRVDRVLRRAHRLPRSDRGDLAWRAGADLRGPPDPRLHALRVLLGS